MWRSMGGIRSRAETHPAARAVGPREREVVDVMDDEGTRQSYERAHDPSRVLALSDGVFASIIPLLVLEIHVPDLAQGQSLRGPSRRSGRPSRPFSSASWWSPSPGRAIGPPSLGS